ncbi:hypothetical protein K438DRAFT_1748400 [Mycena galopus ATCC 62051]|nr:hypothetical protein K438DRAFT_1748400 [Mycena galopus ATCC 62051]
MRHVRKARDAALKIQSVGKILMWVPANPGPSCTRGWYHGHRAGNEMRTSAPCFRPHTHDTPAMESRGGSGGHRVRGVGTVSLRLRAARAAQCEGQTRRRTREGKFVAWPLVYASNLSAEDDKTRCGGVTAPQKFRWIALRIARNQVQNEKERRRRTRGRHRAPRSSPYPHLSHTTTAACPLHARGGPSSASPLLNDLPIRRSPPPCSRESRPADASDTPETKEGLHADVARRRRRTSPPARCKGKVQRRTTSSFATSSGAAKQKLSICARREGRCDAVLASFGKRRQQAEGGKGACFSAQRNKVEKSLRTADVRGQAAQGPQLHAIRGQVEETEGEGNQGQPEDAYFTPPWRWLSLHLVPRGKLVRTTENRGSLSHGQIIHAPRRVENVGQKQGLNDDSVIKTQANDH